MSFTPPDADATTTLIADPCLIELPDLRDLV